MRTPLEDASLARIAGLIAARRIEELRPAAGEALRRGATAADLRELAMVAALFCGFPAGVAALRELRRLGDRTVHRHAPPDSREALRRAGEATFRSIHGPRADLQLELLEDAHPDFADTVLSEAYGAVLSREYLSLAERELVGVAVLTALHLPAQLRAHLHAAHRAGVSWERLLAVCRAAAGAAGVDPSEALELVARLSARGAPGS